MSGEIFLELKNGVFDREAIISYLDKVSFAFNDPVDPNVYLFCGSQGVKDSYYQERVAAKEKNDVEFSYALGVIRLQPSLISMGIMCGGVAGQQCRDFLKWLLSTYDLSITDDYGNDLTEQAKKDIEPIFKR